MKLSLTFPQTSQWPCGEVLRRCQYTWNSNRTILRGDPPLLSLDLWARRAIMESFLQDAQQGGRRSRARENYFSMWSFTPRAVWAEFHLRRGSLHIWRDWPSPRDKSQRAVDLLQPGYIPILRQAIVGATAIRQTAAATDREVAIWWQTERRSMVHIMEQSSKINLIIFTWLWLTIFSFWFFSLQLRFSWWLCHSGFKFGKQFFRSSNFNKG